MYNDSAINIILRSVLSSCIMFLYIVFSHVNSFEYDYQLLNINDIHHKIVTYFVENAIYTAIHGVRYSL